MKNSQVARFAFSSGLLLMGVTALSFGSAHAQPYGYGPPPGYVQGPPERVEVTVPRFREAPEQKLNGPLEKVSLSVQVPYSDLDLVSYRGARELRRRVREAAWNVCAQLGDAYLVYQLQGTHCYKEALDNALVRADAAITSARVDYRQAYYDRYGY